ncbi:hypothetical protein CQW23_22015 [Capsicum baccatum]|uniref:Uncharacterized protein n=1 Tax=Capsicum baccatum TaxID=33114 RepID=A0A2G2VZN8_CAPBA|nr:hypothetical protein CQW23_22015 [Capsicum baccatum]
MNLGDEVGKILTPTSEPTFILLSPTPVPGAKGGNTQSVNILPSPTADYADVERRKEESKKHMGMQLSINDDQSESGPLSKNYSAEVEQENTKFSGSDTSATQVIMEESPESKVNLASIVRTDTEERYPSETSYGDCSTSGTSHFGKVLQKNKCLRVGETNK